MRRVTIVLVVLGLAGVACGGGGTNTATTPTASSSPTPSESPIPPNTVVVANDAFSPSNVSVAVGTTVTWTNINGTNPHNVVSADKLFDSNPQCTGSTTPCMKVGEKFTYTFGKAGTFRYFCHVHGYCTSGSCGGMSGVVNVA